MAKAQEQAAAAAAVTTTSVGGRLIAEHAERAPKAIERDRLTEMDRGAGRARR